MSKSSSFQRKNKNDKKRNKNSWKVKEQLFLAYFKVKKSGKYNMKKDIKEVMKEADLNEKDYLYVKNNYEELKKRFDPARWERLEEINVPDPYDHGYDGDGWGHGFEGTGVGVYWSD